MIQQEEQLLGMMEDLMQQLRSKATELLLREEWKESVHAYSDFISLCHTQMSKINLNPSDTHHHLAKLQKTLCLALSNRAEAQFRLRDLDKALEDCEKALEIESNHLKTLICKGKILLNMNRYSTALYCFKTALLDSQASGSSETLNGYFERCKKLEFLSRTGAFDLSDWVLSGFRGKTAELAEYIGAVQIKKSMISGRGLFATKNIDTGTLLFVTKAIATERGILTDSGENAQLVMWKEFIHKVTESATKCHRTRHLIRMLSTGENEEGLTVADTSLFRPEAEEVNLSHEIVDMGRILSVLDVNSLVEDAISAKVLGKNGDYYGVGLWILASFINHSCNPNARRLHVGDHVIVHASRDVKAGEELTFGYFDVLLPLEKRKEMSAPWGFHCICRRCKFEEELCSRPEMREIEMGLEKGLDLGNAVFRLEETMRRWVMRGKEKGHLRASFWAAYSEVYQSEKMVRKWGRRIPAMEAVVDSVVEAVGSDDRVLKVLVESLKKRGGGGLVDVERAMKLGRGVYGKVVKKQAMRTILELGLNDQNY